MPTKEEMCDLIEEEMEFHKMRILTLKSRRIDLFKTGKKTQKTDKAEVKHG